MTFIRLTLYFAPQEWKEELMLPVMTPTMADAIEISLFDDDGVISPCRIK
jgi:hypothetical protein